jgi:hypothetical protein
MNTEQIRNLVERAGAVYVGITGESVRFAAQPGGQVISLYVFACRSVEDVRLGLKAERERLSVDVWQEALAK